MIKNMFEHFDSDKSGKMSIAELGNFMRAIGKKLVNNDCRHLKKNMRVFWYNQEGVHYTRLMEKLFKNLAVWPGH